jgi:hypothetical protein
MEDAASTTTADGKLAHPGSLDVQAFVDGQLAACEGDPLAFNPGAKSIVSPLVAVAIASRSDPAPLSALLVTVSVLSRVRSSIRSNSGRNRVFGVWNLGDPSGPEPQVRGTSPAEGSAASTVM